MLYFVPVRIGCGLTGACNLMVCPIHGARHRRGPIQDQNVRAEEGQPRPRTAQGMPDTRTTVRGEWVGVGEGER